MFRTFYMRNFYIGAFYVRTFCGAHEKLSFIESFHYSFEMGADVDPGVQRPNLVAEQP